MRIHTHEIDTQARKIIPIALPRQWEYREVTGRDYGVDMEVEIFEENDSTGQVLLIQIKGTEQEIIFKDGFSTFDVPTKTLIYSERYITPLILAICNINNKSQSFHYIWIQDFIKSVLNFENPNWRKNKYTTRVKVPIKNVMPGNEEHLIHISHFPQRLYGACEIARALDNILHSLIGDPFSDDYMKASLNLKEILEMPGFLTNQWHQGDILKNNYLLPAIFASRLLAENREPTDEECKFLHTYEKIMNFCLRHDRMSKADAVKFCLKSTLSTSLDCLPIFFEETNYKYKNILWNHDFSHEF